MYLLSRRQVDALGHQDTNFAAFPADSWYSPRERHLLLLCANSASLYARLLLNSDYSCLRHVTLPSCVQSFLKSQFLVCFS